MAKYEIWAALVGSAYLGEVEAENEQEAIEKGEAFDPGHISLCHQCSGKVCDGLEVEKIQASLLG